MMDKIVKNNYENRLKELHLNLIRSFDIGYSRANATHYPAKKPKLMIREDNRTQSPLSYPDKTQSSDLRIYEHAMQLHDLQSRNILPNKAPGRYSPISPPLDSNDNNQNGLHKPITNPYLPFSVLKTDNLIAKTGTYSSTPENLSKKIIDDEDEGEGNLVINENPKNEENTQIAEELTKKKEKSPLLYIRKPQHRKNFQKINFEDEETSADTSKRESSDDEQEEIIDVVSVSPQHTWNQSNELQIEMDEKYSNLTKITGCNEKLKQPEIISQNCKDEEIQMLKQIKNNSELEMNNMRLFYLNINKDLKMKEKDIAILWKQYSRSIEDYNRSLIRGSSMDIVSSTNYYRERRENNEKIDFRIEYPSNLKIASNNNYFSERKEFMAKDEWLRNLENCNSCSKINSFPFQAFVTFPSSN